MSEPRVHVVGFGMGPHHLTRQGEAVLRGCDHVLAFRKGTGTDPLLEVRRAVAAGFGLTVVEIEDPERDRDDPADYPGAVREWHAARARALASALTEHPGTAALLVWGDPALYDSTLRLLALAAEHLDLAWTVTPGISAPQALAAAHRIVLHEVGRPVHVTTARRLPEAVAAGQDNVLVMLGQEQDWLRTAETPAMSDWQVWWAANLGHDSERLVAGVVGEVGEAVARARARCREEAGWVMDAYLLRAPQGAPA